MPKALIATQSGTCARCGQAYESGDPVTYSKLSPGQRFHSPDCSTANAKRRAGSAAAAGTTETTMPTSTDPLDRVAALRAAIAAIEANKGKAVASSPATTPAPAAAKAPAAPASTLPMEAKALIKSVTTRSKWWEILEAVLAAGMSRILLVGPPGTGKSTTADRDGLRVTCHEDAGPESMVGTFIQKDGNTIWINGPSVNSMIGGTRVVLDEIGHASPECMSLLYALLDDAPSIMLPTGENVKAKKGYQVICTSNDNPADLADAILDRIEAVIVADIPHPAAVEGVRSDAGVNAEKLVGLMTNYYRGAGKGAFEWRGNPTLRKCRNFAKLLAAGLNQEVAASVVFGKAGAEVTSAMTTSSAR